VADLTADDLLTPRGRLIPKVHFPGQSLKSVKNKLGVFLTLAKEEGADTADPRLFQFARGYERGFDEVYQRLLVVAADVSVDEGRRAFLAQQIQAVQAERDKYAAEADGMLDDSAAPVAPYPVTVESRSIPNVFTRPSERYCPPVGEAGARRWLGR
jgi:hypothetical protein